MRQKLMRGFMALAIALFAAQGVLAAEAAPARPPDESGTAEKKPDLTTRNAKMSYALGSEIGRNLKKSTDLGMEVDLGLAIRAIKDYYRGKSLMTDGEIDSVMNAVRAEVMIRTKGEKMKMAMENLKKGAEFLAENKKKEGVIELPDGLQYKIIRKGEGRKPGDKEMVVCNYRASLINGTVFDSTYERGQPAVIDVSNGYASIAGFREALKLMPVGSRWQLFIPPHLGYREAGKKPHIGPNETLIFDIEAIDIK